MSGNHDGSGRRRDGRRGGRAAPRADVRPSGWESAGPRIRREPFAGPADVAEESRINFTAGAYADLSAHARASLENEVCGVLLGAVAEDDAGRHVVVEAIIRGSGASSGSAHVTYTHETWNRIFAAKDRDHPDLAIVGWYHTHPGFGTDFSDMDMFIQDNFFSGPDQFAYVVDPIGGAESICVNSPARQRHPRRFWVNGRERNCVAPVGRVDAATSMGDATAPHSAGDLRALEDRLVQLTREFERQRAFLQNVVLGLTLGIALAFSYVIVSDITDRSAVRSTMPKLQQTVPVPVRVGEQDVILGIGIYAWDVPDDVSSLYREIAEAAARDQTRRAAGLQQPGDGADGGSGWWRPLVSGRTGFAALGLLLMGAGGASWLAVRRRRSGSRAWKEGADA